MEADNNLSQPATNQPIDQVPASPLPLTASNKKYLIIVGGVLLLLLVGIGGYLIGTQSGLSKPERSTFNNGSTSLSQINSPAEQVNLKVPFVRDGNVYLYESGQETLISAKAPQTQSAYGNIYPTLSPNGKYLAYLAIAQRPKPDQIYIPEGTINIYSFDTKQTIVTIYRTSYFQWNKFNQLEFKTLIRVPAGEAQGVDIDTAQSKVFFFVYDPETQKEVASQTMSYDEYDKSGKYGFPLYSDQKKILFKNNGYYLLSNNQEKFLFKQDNIYRFSGWSPDGTMAIFSKQGTDTLRFIALDTSNPQLPAKDVQGVELFGAGGSPSTGLKWYFNKGFISYCSEHIFFVDGTGPLELTRTGGGGCHNEEGFVATSPNNEYTFVKFGDRFELHIKDGTKTVIKEIDAVEKTRFSPRELIWLNNDFMAIYDYDANKKRIFLFNRRQNTIRKLIDNASFSYL